MNGTQVNMGILHVKFSLLLKYIKAIKKYCAIFAFKYFKATDTC